MGYEKKALEFHTFVLLPSLLRDKFIVYLGKTRYYEAFAGILFLRVN